MYSSSHAKINRINWWGFISFIFSFWYSSVSIANPIVNNIPQAVWVNEAIITTYTMDFEHFITQEKEIAKYFTSEGWISYSKALNASKLPENIKTNSYYVSAVATLPPTIKMIDKQEWEANMPILVIYKNPVYQQKQQLMITLRFIASMTQGVRGLAIKSITSTEIAPPCRCAQKAPSAAIV